MNATFPYGDQDIAKILVLGLRGKPVFDLTDVRDCFGCDIETDLMLKAIRVLSMIERDGAIRCVRQPFETAGPKYQFCVPVVVDWVQ